MKGKSDLQIKSNKLILPEQPHHDDFLQVMSKLFKYSSYFGVMGSKLATKIWFTFVLMLLVVVESAAVWKVIKAVAGWAVDTAGNRSVTARLSGTIFYAVAMLSLLLSSKLSMSWGTICDQWMMVDRSMSINLPNDNTLKIKMTFAIFVMLIFSAAEHILSMISVIGLDCEPSLILKKYTLMSHGFIILKSEYSDWLPIPVICVRIIGTFLWSYQDLLIVLLSLGLTSRYQRLNRYVEKVSALEKRDNKWNKNMQALKLYSWRKIREAYVKQANLVRMIDGHIGSMIVLSCFCNFYFICLQLFLGITQGKTISLMRRIYYSVSLLWLFIRIGGVVLAASDINVQSKSALKYMFHCDAHCYNVEIERLQNQLSKDNVAFSGLGFFYLNRTILLQMLGAIVTYELVLIQFDDSGTENNVKI